MPLGPQSEEWTALASLLATLADRMGASNACVTDAWGHLWCRGHVLEPEAQERVLVLARNVLEHSTKPLTRGGHLDGGTWEDDRGWYARSFAGVYVVLILFGGPFEELSVRRVLRDLLPQIEALTLALPPADGPAWA